MKIKKECLADVSKHEAIQAWRQAWAWEREASGGGDGLGTAAMSLKRWEACLAWGRAVATGLDWERLEKDLETEGNGGAWVSMAIKRVNISSKAVAADPWASVGVLALTMEIRRGLSKEITSAAAARGCERQRRETQKEKAGFAAMSVKERTELRAFSERCGMVEQLMDCVRAIKEENDKGVAGDKNEPCLAISMALEDRQFDNPGHIGAGCALEALRCLGLLAEGLSPDERAVVAAAWGGSAGGLLGAPTAGSMDWLCASLGTACARWAVDAAQGALLGEAASAVDGEMSSWAMAGDGSGAKAAVDACVLQLVLSDVLSGKERKEADDWVQALGLLLRCMGHGARRFVLDQWEAVGPEERCVAWAVCAPEERLDGVDFYEAAARCDVAPWAQPLASQILAEKAARELGALVGIAACAPKQDAPGVVRL